MGERTIFSLSEQDALLLADELVHAARRGEANVLVEHWPSTRTSVAVKGQRVWGPPIRVESYRTEQDPDPLTHYTRMAEEATGCSADDWPRKAS